MHTYKQEWRSIGLMVSALDSGLSGPGPLCCVPRQDTLLSQCFSLSRCTNK